MVHMILFHINISYSTTIKKENKFTYLKNVYIPFRTKLCNINNQRQVVPVGTLGILYIIIPST